LLIASDPIVVHRGSSTMILSLGMGCMGLCSICSRRHNPKEREGVLVKDYKLRGRWAIWIGVVRLRIDT
jgi:L-lysine 2,3-aminomutase